MGNTGHGTDSLRRESKHTGNTALSYRKEARSVVPTTGKGRLKVFLPYVLGQGQWSQAAQRVE